MSHLPVPIETPFELAHRAGMPSAHHMCLHGPFFPSSFFEWGYLRFPRPWLRGAWVGVHSTSENGAPRNGTLFPLSPSRYLAAGVHKVRHYACFTAGLLEAARFRPFLVSEHLFCPLHYYISAVLGRRSRQYHISCHPYGFDPLSVCPRAASLELNLKTT